MKVKSIFQNTAKDLGSLPANGLPALSTVKSLPVKLSAQLVVSAKDAAQASDRSLTAQIEHWSRLGREVEKILPFAATTRLKAGAALMTKTENQELAKALGCFLSSSDRTGVLNILNTSKDPVYEADPENTDGIRQVWPDGRTVSGRFLNRVFIPTER
jgi:ParD-like antitoxin of type II bacterial toxin-antitoxin system